MQALEAGITGSLSTSAEESAALYRELLEALRQEIEMAIGAIASNSLDHLQESISMQEALCTHLQILAAAAFGRGRESHAELSPVYRQIRESSRKLCALLMDYDALLRHSGHSVAILVSLCRGHLGAFPSASGAENCRRNSLGEA